MEDAVGIDIERHFDLRHAARSRRNPGELEFPDGAVVLRHLPLALQHVNLDRRLSVLGRREDFRLLRRNGRVPRDEHRCDAAECLDTE